MSLRTLLVCPGRGTYTSDDLGSLGRRIEAPGAEAARALVARADGLRRERGSKTITELDGAERYSAALHLEGENAGPLIFTCSAVDLALLPRERFRPVAAVGNSMGWYTALHAGGVFGFDHAFQLVDVMSKTQGRKPLGGQLIMPWVDEDWRPVPSKRAAIDAALATVQARGLLCGVSIELGGHLVLAGEDAAVAALRDELPKETFGGRDYPFQLARHAAFHTPLMAAASAMGLENLSSLPWRAPTLPLIDGAGWVRRPGLPSPDDMRRYTLVDQVLQTYDFTLSLRVALREYAPDVVVLLGPGQSLGGAIGQTFVLEGWRGIRSKADFVARQRSDSPPLIAVGRPDQYARFIAS